MSKGNGKGYVSGEDLPLAPHAESNGSTNDAECDARIRGGHTTRALAAQNCTEKSLTRVDNERFEMPVVRLEKSGGTAPFFQLSLREAEREKRSKTYFIGKDLSHTQDEVEFYEEALVMKKSNADEMGALLDFMFEYEGVLTAPEKDAPAGAKPIEMLVLRNLFDGCEKLRMLDVKIGQKTSSAGWYGKSNLKSLLTDFRDGLTNSAEGYRMAGFNGPPSTFTSRDPLLDIGGLWADANKKALRASLSQVTGAEMFEYLLDVHEEPADPGDAALSERLAPLEVAELVHHEAVQSLVSLAVACRNVRIPQKWVGSSICIAFDCRRLPERKTPEAELRKAVQVNIFDWGRSELNTPEKHEKLTEEEQHDREQFWGYYVGGVDLLAWEAVRAYWHRFGNASSWDKVVAIVYDYDSFSEDDFLGEVELNLNEVVGKGPQTAKLKTGRSKNFSLSAFSSGEEPTITYSVELRHFPAGSRLRDACRICFHSAAKLPIADFRSQSSDPYVTLVARSDDGKLTFHQRTSVIAANLNPTWNETLELPLAMLTNEGRLGRLLGDAFNGTEITGELSEVLFPPQGCPSKQTDEAQMSWVQLLGRHTGKSTLSLGKGSTGLLETASRLSQLSLAGAAGVLKKLSA